MDRCRMDGSVGGSPDPPIVSGTTRNPVDQAGGSFCHEGSRWRYGVSV